MVSEATIRESIKSREYPESEDNEDIIDSGLRDEGQFIEENPAEQRRQAEELRYCEALVLSQAKQLTQLWEKLLKEGYVSHSLDQNIKMLLTPDDSHKSQGPDLREQLADGHQLAEHHVNRLSPDIGEEEDEDDRHEKTEEVLESDALGQYEAQDWSLVEELTQLWDKLREELDVSDSLKQDSKMLLTPDDSHKSQGPDLQGQLANGCQLEGHHVNSLSPGTESYQKDEKDERMSQKKRVSQVFPLDEETLKQQSKFKPKHKSLQGSFTEY
ncbi:putative neuroblastoma breakpoint family member 5 [Plecturocebus cupreus]